MMMSRVVSNWRFRFGSYNTRNNSFQNIAVFQFFLHCFLLSLLFEILLEFNRYLNLQMNRNINSLPIAHFRFVNVVLRKEKSKKERNVVRCSQNLDLNPTYAEAWMRFFKVSNSSQGLIPKRQQSVSWLCYWTFPLCEILHQFKP